MVIVVNTVRRGYMGGYVKNLVHPSPIRKKPFCPHYGVCGGCTWQALPYSMQLEFKQQQVIDQLTRIGHLTLPEVSPILGSEKTEYYRNKLEYTFSNRRWVISADEAENIPENERLGLGFHIGGHFDKVLDIEECHLQREPSNAIRLFVKQYAIENGLSFFDLRESHGFMRNLMIRTTSTGQVMVLVAFGAEAEKEPDKVRALLDALIARFPQTDSLHYVINPKCNDALGDLKCTLYHGDEAVYEQMENLRFKIGPKSFYQTNSEQAYRLYCVVRDFVREGISDALPAPVIYDLYTGTGTIALFLIPLTAFGDVAHREHTSLFQPPRLAGTYLPEVGQRLMSPQQKFVGIFVQLGYPHAVFVWRRFLCDYIHCYFRKIEIRSDADRRGDAGRLQHIAYHRDRHYPRRIYPCAFGFAAVKMEITGTVYEALIY